MTADVQRELAEELAEYRWLTDDDRGVLVLALLPTVQALIADAEKRAAAAAIEPFERLFAGDPDTACRTTWRREPGWSLAGSTTPLTECVEVPMDDLRAAFDAAAALGPSGAAEGAGR